MLFVLDPLEWCRDWMFGGRGFIRDAGLDDMTSCVTYVFRDAWNEYKKERSY